MFFTLHWTKENIHSTNQSIVFFARMTSKNLKIILPSLNEETKQYRWPLVTVKKTANKKGLGLFAKKYIAAGTCFPYFGKVYRDMKKLNKYLKLYPHKWKYLMEQKNQAIYFDADPKWDTNNLFLMGRVNEPGRKEESNSTFLSVIKFPCVLLLVFKDVRPQEEILTNYGGYYQRGYPRGRISAVPKQFPKSRCYLNKETMSKIAEFINILPSAFSLSE